MGLAISKEIIEKQLGDIGVNSDSGKGSYFYFRLS
jgi:signal transduction histidine kinase